MYKSFFNSRSYHYRYNWWMLLLLPVMLFMSCRKEYQVPPVGKAIPYKDTIPGLTDYINSDKEHDLFWSLWKKSNITKLLDSLSIALDTARLTIFVPGNDALLAAGWDAASTSGARQASVDSLVFFHTYHQQVIPGSLIDVSNNFLTSFFTGFGQKTFLGGGSGGTNNPAGYNDPWFIFLGSQNGDLLVNRKVVGKLAGARVTKNVTIFNIDKVLQKPMMSTREWLTRDGRFTMYLGIRRYNDSVYNSLLGVPFSYADVPYERHQFAAGAFSITIYGLAVYYPVLDLLANEQHLYDSVDLSIHTDHRIMEHTLLAPTDEAFHQAGFSDLNALIAFDLRYQPYAVLNDPGSAPPNSICSGFFPIDSVLNLHLFGFNPFPTYGPFDNSAGFTVNSGLFGLSPASPVLFYSNVFESGFLSGDGSTTASSFDQVSNPFDFFTSGNMIRIRPKGSTYEAATITEPDIETYNGIIHVVDRLLVPQGFKFTN